MRSSRWRGKSVNSKKYWRRWLYRFFHPSYPILLLVSLIAYPALCCLFLNGQTESIAAYAMYYRDDVGAWSANRHAFPFFTG